MTRRQALEVLFRHAAADCAGTGRGIRPVPDRATKREVRDAIARLYPDAYGREMEVGDARNLGLWICDDDPEAPR
jgi:hypothetical protein